MADLSKLDLDSMEAMLNQQNSSQQPPIAQQTNSAPQDMVSEGQQQATNGNEVDSAKSSRHSSRHRHKHSKKKHKKRSRSRSKRKHRSRSGERRKRRSKSRSSSRRRHRKRRDSRDRRRSGSRRSRKSSNESKEKKRSQERGDSEYMKRQIEKEKKVEEEKKQTEIKALEDNLKEAARQLEEARRDDSTVLIIGLNIRTKERGIYEFFREAQVGKIRDIRIIKDPKNGKSKGLAYVEFYNIESVPKAVACTGLTLEGGTLRIQPSQAEKNRTAANQKQQQKTKEQEATKQVQVTGPLRIVVSGLTDQLEGLEDYQLHQIFSQFGEIEKAEILRDDFTGKSKGYGYVTYKNAGDAQKAINEMNGFIINKKQITVSTIEPNMVTVIENNNNNQGVDLDDDNIQGGYLRSAQSRQELMAKLSRGGQEDGKRKN